MATIENLSLNDGNTIPQLGLGTYKMDDQQARESVRYALEVGYRHVDTASFYANEEGVGQGIADAIAAGTLTREELFVTTKVWNDAQSQAATRASVAQSLRKLDVDYLDLVLVHWPVAAQGRFGECFDTLLELKRDGLIRSVGVANFYPEVLDQLSEAPAVNQIELHPQFPQDAQIADDARRGIRTQAWSPIGRATYLDNSPIAEIATELVKHRRRWPCAGTCSAVLSPFPSRRTAPGFTRTSRSATSRFPTPTWILSLRWVAAMVG